jgi:4-phospho-D-threonate 3-dehydrogenase / 4-phospho-D-erythronate 3-dehydrogenase
VENYPAIGVTLGDPGGIGPEVLLKALQGSRSIHARLILFGSVRVLRHHSRVLNLPFPRKSIEVVDINNVPEPYFGPNPPASGQCSIDYLEAAFQFYLRGEIQALVTGPIHKESWHAAGYRYPGQTEYCAAKTGTAEYCMLMVSDRFRIAVLSTHLSLRDAITQLTEDQLARKIRLLDREFRKLGFPKPRIGCAALNPHAGEGGAFGSEEQAVMIPLMERLRSEGIAVEGPFAPEVIFRVAARDRKWDVVLAMYHDQAMIPLKLLDFERSANVTLGLPLIRTSPDHGTAFDIAGRGIADPGSMKYAIRLAANWTRKRMSNE